MAGLIQPLQWPPTEDDWNNWQELHALEHENLDDVTSQLPIAGGQVGQLGQQAGAYAGLGNFANDAAAAAGGVPIGGLYRNASVVMVRVS